MEFFFEFTPEETAANAIKLGYTVRGMWRKRMVEARGSLEFTRESSR